MTQEEFDKLNTGDVIESLSGSRYVVVWTRSTEPITQIAKDDIKERKDQFKVVMKSEPNSR